MATVELGEWGGRVQGPLEFKDLAQGAFPPSSQTPWIKDAGYLRLKESEPLPPTLKELGIRKALGWGFEVG